MSLSWQTKLLLFISLLVAFRTQLRHLDWDLLWQRHSEFGIPVGSGCEAATGQEPESGPASWAAILGAPHAFKPLPMPYKSAAHRGDIRTDDPGQYLLVRCPFDPRSLRPTGFAMLHLARVFGMAVVALNGAVRAQVQDDGVVDVPLTPEDRRAPAVLEILAWPRPPLMAAGLASNDPPLATDDREALTDLRVALEASSRDIPAYRAGLGLGLSLVFAAVWLLGIRYRDVGWMVIATTLLTLQHALWYKTTEVTAVWQRLAFGWLELAGGLAMAAFMLTFLRPRGAWLGPLLAAFAAVTAVYGCGYLVLPLSVSNHALYRLTVPYAATGIAWITAGVLGMRCTPRAPRARRRRLRTVGVLAVLGGVSYLVQIHASGAGIVYVPYLRLAFAVMFAAWLGADLVVFQRRFFEEQAARRGAEADAAVDRQIARVTQMVAHDVRKPFSLLRVLLRMLANEQDGAKIKRMALAFGREVEGALTGVDAMLEDLLAAGRKTPVALAPVGVRHLLAGAMQDAFRGEGRADVSFRYELGHRTAALANGPLARRLLVNLLTNAAEAVGSGEILITTRDGAAGIEIAVTNGGPPIPPEVMGRLFEPFTPSGKQGSTGLGLAITRKLATAMGGDVRCTSTAEAGTTFALELRSAPAVLDDATLPATSRAVSAAWHADLASLA